MQTSKQETAKSNTEKKYEDIRAAYTRWTNRKYKGVQIYREKLIYLRLAEQFYLSPKTIEDIVYYRTKY